MSNHTGKKKETSNLETELYLLIAKFLSTGPCKGSAELLRKELEEHELLPKRIDWLGNEHSRTFNELDSSFSQIADDHLLKICSRVGPILDKELPPTVSGLTSLLGVGRQSFLRTKEDLQKPKCHMLNLLARKNGMPMLPSQAFQSQYPTNIAQVLISRESSGALTCRHTFTPKVHARQQNYKRILGHLSSVYCVLFDRTGKYIFTGADDLLVKIWSSHDGRLLAALRGHSAEITDMAVNHENTLLAAGSCDKTIRVWCLRTTAPVAVLCGHTGMVTSLQFCPYPKNDDRLLISTGNDGCVCFWHWNPKTNAFNPKPLKFTERNKPNAQMICSSFSSGGLFLATGSTDHNVRVYNITGQNGPEKILEREVHTDRVDSMQFSNRDCRFISGSKDGTALIWKYERQNWTSIQLKMSTKLPGQSEEAEDNKSKLKVNMVGWTLDDSRVITAVSDCTIKVWNSRNGDLCTILKGHEDEVFVLEPHPTDCRVFLSSGHDGRVIIWDLVTGTIIKNHFNLIEGQGHGAVFDCKFSPDGLMFASTDSHGHLSIFGFGSAERYKKVPEEQFFHTDYRPLIRDIHHHVLDEQTQTATHLLPPPFLVDIDGNPYPPNLQRLVPGREHHNDSQLVPYVAVSAEGDSEIFEPVRPANDAVRPTIDDMIERLNQEIELDLERDNDRQDGARSPHSSHRSFNGDRNGSEPFSPRTPRAQAGHSRVGLRRTGDVEGVQSVGNWQSRDSQADVPSWVKRVVVKPVTRSLAKSFMQKRIALADIEISIFNKERKRRPISESGEESRSSSKNEGRYQKQSGLRAGLRSSAPEEMTNPREESENQGNTNTHSSSDSETDQQEDMFESDESDSGDYSDWTENRPTMRPKPKTQPQPSTSGTSSRRQASMRQIKPRRRLVSSNEEGDTEDESEDEDEGEEMPSNETERTKKSKAKPSPAKKKTAVNGSKLQNRYHPPPEWLTDTMPNKAPYFPQIGDEVMYFRQGHESYVQAVKRNRTYDIFTRNQPWRKINLRDQEVARIDDITYVNNPPILCCLQLSLLNPASKHADKFTVKYHDMADVIDFIILKQNYDQAMCYDWKIGDRFRSAIDKVWWLGTIKAHKPLNLEFPDSMFQCFLVKWDNGEKEHMSPWDFEPIDNERLPDEEGGSVDILPDERLAMMYVPESHEWSTFGRDHDCDRIARGLARIMELSIADNFTDPVDLNLYPSYSMYVEYPMDLRTIKCRVQNRFYRRLDALKFDVKYIEINASKFNEHGSQIIKKAKCVVDLFLRFIDLPHCTDPMILYHEMMEAKQSRSQDSQSELDVLCSESDSDGEHITSSRIKRKKKNALQQSSKRVRLEDKKYTSKSWKQQCSALLDNFFQCEDSTPFRYPVNLNDYPDYRNIIDIPMDLSTVREKLNNCIYNSPGEFCKDMRMIFQNSRNYNINKKSRIYSMTIRLSAMFEELIRSIVSDWRSAVKYEEKIRNNQYVSQRRKPLLIQEGGVNVGASTSSLFTSSSSSRTDTSRQSSSRHVNNAFSVPGSSRSHHRKMSNGTGPRKKIKHEASSQAAKASSIRFKKKSLKPAIGTPLSNGMDRKRLMQAAKRKIPDRSPRKASERIRKQEHSYAEFSHSDSNSSNHSNSSIENSASSEMERRRKSKRRRKDSNLHLQKTTIRTQVIKKTRISTRSSTSYHPKSSVYSSSLRAHAKSTISAQNAHSRSSSPENGWSPLKKRSLDNKLSPLTTRSRRQVKNSLTRAASSSQRYKNSGETSDSDDASASQSFRSSNVRGKRLDVTKSLSPHHTRSRNTRARKPVSYRLLNSGESFESDASESQSFKSENRKRVVQAKLSSRPTRSKNLIRHTSRSNQKPHRLQEEEENSGESSAEDSDASEESRSLKSERTSNSSGGSSSKSKMQTTTESSSKSQQFSSSDSEGENSDLPEQRPRRTTRFANRDVRASALSARGMQSPGKSGRVVTRYRGQRTVQYQEGNSDDSENGGDSSRFNSRGYLRSLTNEEAQKHDTCLGVPEKSIKEEGLARKASSSSNGKRLGSVIDDQSNDESRSSSHNLRTNRCNVSNFNFTSSSGRKSAYCKFVHAPARRGLKALTILKNKKFNVNYSKCIKKASSALSAKNRSALMKRPVFKSSAIVKKPIVIKCKATGGIGMQSKRNSILKKYSPISLNTRSKIQLGLVNSKEPVEKTEKVHKKPTIVFCKPLPSSSSEINSTQVVKANKLKNDCNSSEKSNHATSEKCSGTSNSSAISFHTRSSSPKLLEPLPPPSHKFSSKRKGSSPTSKKIQNPSTSADNSLHKTEAKLDHSKGCKTKNASPPAPLTLRDKVSLSTSRKIKEPEPVLENKSKWCLRKALRGSETASPINVREPGSSKVQTRNRGQRTVGYNEDSDNNYLTEILENEDPIKSKHRYSLHAANERKDPVGSLPNCSLNKLHKTNYDEKCSPNCDKMTSKSNVTILRPKKEALKMLSNGIETRNHGQRTTVYAEDGDDYLEEYFENLELGL